jgi:GAF domain-containing protein
MQDSVDQVVQAVPECVGLSISLRDADLTFTWVRANDMTGVIDAMQYLEDGPCQQSIDTGDDILIDDILDEDRWQLFALVSAAQGVRSSLSLPLRSDGAIIGSVNFYAATANAFMGEESRLARSFGSRAEDTINNADLSMSTLANARKAPQVLAEMAVVDQAMGILVAKHHIGFEQASKRLTEAAARAGITVADVARAVVQSVVV